MTEEKGGFSPEKLLSSLNRTGVAKASHFEVMISGPPEDIHDMRDMMYRAEAVELPGRSIASVDHRFSNYGPVNKVATGQTYADVSISFLLSEDLREKEFFELWQDSIVDTGAFEVGGNSRTRSTYSRSKFNTKYFKDYIGTVTIRQYGANGDLRSVHYLDEAYPLIVGGVAMNWNEEGFAKMTVSFTYKNYRAVFYKKDQPGLGVGFSIKMSKNGLQGALRLPGFGTIAGGGGFGTQANLAPLKQKIFSSVGLY